MGKLVQFERRRGGTKLRERKPGQGEVVIFTGVRYERAEATQPDKPPASAGSKRKRG